MMVQDDTTLEQRVDRLITKPNSNPAPAPQPQVNRDNSQNYSRPPFQSNPRSKRDYRQSPGHPQFDMRQNLRGPEPSAAGPFGETDVSRPIQCFRCRGWGHPKRLCPSRLNYTWGEWYRTIPPRQWKGDQKVLLHRTFPHLVLVKKKGFTSKHKIADKWETEPYEIVSQCSDGLPVYTVMRNDRERTLHRNMLFPLGLRHDTERILPNLAEFENTENPDLNQVDNFSIDDGEIDQLIYEGPQTRSCTRKLMKANCLMADLFDIESGKICDMYQMLLLFPK